MIGAGIAVRAESVSALSMMGYRGGQMRRFSANDWMRMESSPRSLVPTKEWGTIRCLSSDGRGISYYAAVREFSEFGDGANEADIAARLALRGD
jgi:hypothetical protein